MDYIEPIFEVVFNNIIPWLFMLPGALIRWIIAKFSGSKKTYRDFYKAGGFLTGFLGFLVYVLLFIWIF